MQNLEVFFSNSLFLGLASLKEAWQGVCSRICFFLAIIDVKMVPKELLGPANLSRVWTLGIYKLLKVVVVDEDKNLIFAAFEVVAPSLKGFNNSQELLIVTLVPSLSGEHLLREKSYWVPLANFGLRRIWIFVGHVIGRMLIQSHLI